MAHAASDRAVGGACFAGTLFIQGTVEWEDMQRIAEQFKRVQDIRFEVIEGLTIWLP